MTPNAAQEFTAAAVKKQDHIDAVLKSAYKTPQWGLAGAFSSAGTVRLTSLCSAA